MVNSGSEKVFIPKTREDLVLELFRSVSMGDTSDYPIRLVESLTEFKPACSSFPLIQEIERLKLALRLIEYAVSLLCSSPYKVTMEQTLAALTVTLKSMDPSATHDIIELHLQMLSVFEAVLTRRDLTQYERFLTQEINLPVLTEKLLNTDLLQD